MYTTRIEVYKCSTERNDYNERSEEPILVGAFWAERTENGGRENLYASRIVHENEVVFSIRYSSSIQPDMKVKCNGKFMRITSTHEEGRREKLHIKCLKIDVED